jgi:hypothetical protein
MPTHNVVSVVDRRWFASMHLFSEADADLRADEDFAREEA